MNSPVSENDSIKITAARKVAGDVAPFIFFISWGYSILLPFVPCMPTLTETLVSVAFICGSWGYVVFFDRSKFRRWFTFTFLMIWGGIAWFQTVTNLPDLKHNLRILMSD